MRRWVLGSMPLVAMGMGRRFEKEAVVAPATVVPAVAPIAVPGEARLLEFEIGSVPMEVDLLDEEEHEEAGDNEEHRDGVLGRRRGHRGLRLEGIRKETEKADGKKDAARERLRVGQKAPPTRRRRRREEEGEHAADQAEDEDDDEEDDLESV